MALHSGHPYREGDVTIGAPDIMALRAVARSSDVESEVDRWTRVAEQQDDAYHFAVYREGDLVGQIFLHDIDWEAGSALVGYHLFESFRGQGTGTAALGLLQTFVIAEMALSHLVMITSGDNVPSKRIAEKCGFTHIGAPREDPNGICMRWDVPASLRHPRDPSVK